MPQGIILAAGTSSRAKTNKLLLKHQGLFLIEHAIKGMRPFVTKIVVVTGHYHDEMVPVLNRLANVEIVHNQSYMSGMFSSILAGLAHIETDCFILPGDCPFPGAEVYEKLLAATDTIRVPEYDGRLGHPIWLAKDVLEKLRNEPLSGNLKEFRDRHGFTRVPVGDRNIITDIDTIADYRRL